MEEIDWQCREFDELGVRLLYEILRLRLEVFSVEQNCIYQDIDGRDPRALHLFGRRGDTLIAYARVFAPGVRCAEASIGRVVTAPTARRTGAGKALMERAVRCADDRWPGAGIRIEAQMYLERFYTSFGFETVSEPYIEDGIKHVTMLRPG